MQFVLPSLITIIASRERFRSCCWLAGMWTFFSGWAWSEESQGFLLGGICLTCHLTETGLRPDFVGLSSFQTFAYVLSRMPVGNLTRVTKRLRFLSHIWWSMCSCAWARKDIYIYICMYIYTHMHRHAHTYNSSSLITSIRGNCKMKIRSWDTMTQPLEHSDRYYQ